MRGLCIRFWLRAFLVVTFSCSAVAAAEDEPGQSAAPVEVDEEAAGGDAEEPQARWDKVRKEYKRCCDSTKEDVRLGAVNILAGVEWLPAAEALAGHVLRDRSEAVAWRAAELLSLLKSDEVLDLLVELLHAQARRADQERLFLLAEAVACMGNKRVVDVLLDLLRENRDEFKLIALMGLARFARLGEELIPLLEPLTRERGSPCMQLAAIQAISRIPSPGVIPVLVAAARQPGIVGRAARITLRRMTGKDPGRTAGDWEDWYQEARAGREMPMVGDPGAEEGAFLARAVEVPAAQRPGSGGGARAGSRGSGDVTWDSQGRSTITSDIVRDIPVVEFERSDNSRPEGSRDGGGDSRDRGMTPIGQVRPATQAQWQAKLKELGEKGLDVVIVFDSTGSMGAELGRMRSAIRDMIRKLKKLVPDTCVGLATYRDQGDEYVVRGLPLAENIGLAERFLSQVEAEGGGDIPEAVHEGLNWVVRNVTFRRDTARVVLLFGDAPPHFRWLRTCTQAARILKSRLGARVSTVQCRTEIPEFTEIGNAGGGQSYILNESRLIMKSIAVLVFGQEYRAFVDRAF